MNKDDEYDLRAKTRKTSSRGRDGRFIRVERVSEGVKPDFEADVSRVNKSLVSKLIAQAAALTLRVYERAQAIYRVSSQARVSKARTHSNTGKSIDQLDRQEAELANDRDYLDKLRGAIDSAAASCTAMWVVFVGLEAYLAVSVLSITSRDIFLETPLDLPLLNIAVPLRAFALLSPAMLLILHAYFFQTLNMVTGNLLLYERLHSCNIPFQGGNATKYLRIGSLLPGLVFVQTRASASDRKIGRARNLSNVIAWLTVVIGPVLLILLIQLQFLAYHDKFATWVHRLAVVCDCALISMYWHATKATRHGAHVAWRLIGLVLSAFPIAFSLGLGTFPGEALDRNRVVISAWLPEISFHRLRIGGTITWMPWPQIDSWISPYELLISGTVNEVTGQRHSLWSNTLVLPDQKFISEEQFEKSAKLVRDRSRPLWEAERIRSLRGRDLRQAVLMRADLRLFDFTGAHLEGADLTNASLQGASFGCANSGLPPRGSGFERPFDLQGCAKLSGALLHGTKLEEVNLVSADLTGAELLGTHAVGANLDQVKMKKARVEYADFSDTKLTLADFEGVDFYQTNLRGVQMVSARGVRSSFSSSQLDGAYATSSYLDGASFAGSSLRAGNFGGAQMKGATFFGTALEAADLSHAQLQGAVFLFANLDGASFREANLAGINGSKLLPFDPTLCVVHLCASAKFANFEFCVCLASRSAFAQYYRVVSSCGGAFRTHCGRPFWKTDSDR